MTHEEPNAACPCCGAPVANVSLRLRSFVDAKGIKSIEEFMDKKWILGRLLREKNMGPATVAEIVRAVIALERKKQ